MTEKVIGLGRRTREDHRKVGWNWKPWDSRHGGECGLKSPGLPAGALKWKPERLAGSSNSNYIAVVYHLLAFRSMTDKVLYVSNTAHNLTRFSVALQIWKMCRTDYTSNHTTLESNHTNTVIVINTMEYTWTNLNIANLKLAKAMLVPIHMLHRRTDIGSHSSQLRLH